MTATIRLQEILAKTLPLLEAFSENQSSEKPAPGKWSKKEILGHLIDSAANNHQRFVRMQHDDGLSLPQYQQDQWVNSQQYQTRKWAEIIGLWKSYNFHLIHVLKNVNKLTLSNTAIFPEYGRKTLQWLIDEYVEHMEHHLKALLK